ncbi:MAG: FlgD immunoglobulin-like domain containing protein, partial [Candidatus Eisenbacteria bacterium]
FGSDDPLAVLPADTALVNGRIDVPVRLARGGYNQISVADVTQPSKTGSSTQVRAISSGFHLEASVTPASAAAGAPFTLTVRVTNDAGSTIQEINSFVTVEVRHASSRAPGRGTLLTTQFQLLQGQRSVSETYTFSEPIVIVARDNAGNDPATTGVITITPGPPTAIQLTSDPTWVGGNKHATLRARLVDAYENGIRGAVMNFERLSGTATLTPIDSLTDSTGTSTADFLSARQPEFGRVRASSGGLIAELDIQTAFVDPNAAGGTVTSYPNPFHPPGQGTTIAYKLADHASVTVRIFTPQGDLVLHRTFARSSLGGLAGLNEFVWDGRNGDGTLVSSGGYLALIEAEGTGETLHVMRRKIAVVR